jgi:SAM-dependent methyltransferase
MAPAGRALGVDISAPAIERARDLAEAQGIRNVTFEQADAQVCRFPRERFDLAVSRFGTMFFGDPVAAFANIGRALRPDGRLVMMVWQAHDRNEWNMAIRRSLAGTEGAAGAAAAASPASPSPTSASPCTSARTWPPPWTGSAASRAPAKHSTAWIPLTPPARSGGCG